MKIKVTQEDIDTGKRCSVCYCPVAKALGRETGRKWMVDKDSACSIDPDVTSYYVKFSQDVHEFVVRFDTHETVEPFEFEFEWSPSE